MEPAPPVTQKVHRSWFIRREVLASAGVLAVAAGVVGYVRARNPAPERAVLEATQVPAAPAVSKTPANGAAAASMNLTIDRSAPAAPPPAEVVSPPPPEKTSPAVARAAAETPRAPEPKRRPNKVGASQKTDKVEPARAEKTAEGDPSLPVPNERPIKIDPPPPENKPGPLLIEKL